MFSSYGRRDLAIGPRPTLPLPATRRPVAPWKARDAFAILGACLLFLLASLIVTLGLFQLQAADTQDANTKDAISAVVFLVFNLFLLWLIHMLIVKRYHYPWRMLGLRSVGWQWVAVVPIVFAFLTFLWVIMYRVLVAVLGPTVQWPKVLTTTAVDSAHQPVLEALIILTGVVLTPLAEELMFRGVLYQAFRRTMPAGVAALGASLIFAGMHFTLVLFIPLTIMGYVLAWLFERSGSLIPGMLVHACNNGIILVLIAGNPPNH